MLKALWKEQTLFLFLLLVPEYLWAHLPFMSQSEEKFQKKRVRSSYITSVISIAMVLLMLGLLGLMLVNAKKLSDTTRESFTVSIFFKDSVDDASILRFKSELESREFIKSIQFISRDEAASSFQEELGEDFVEFLGYNPLPASLDVKFNSNFTEESDFEKLEKEWSANAMVAQIDYPRNLINKIVDNMRKLSWFFLAFSAILAFIAITVINNTIRLAMYSKRFIIRTMQLVGATRSFIRRPYIFSGITQGLLGGLIAIILLGIAVYWGEKEIPELRQMRDFKLLGMLAGGILSGGIFLSWICTFFAVRKYLNLKTDSLY
jgi:cell division transport system permease protein